jgi:formate dehydrogenase
MTVAPFGTNALQTRYAAGVREILECYFDKKPIRTPYLIVQVRPFARMHTRPSWLRLYY